MEQIHFGAPDRQRKRDLFRDRVVPGVLCDRAKVRTERGRKRPILFPAEEDVFGVAIDFRQPAGQIPDVRANPEVMQLAGVDGYPHGY
jgi:hypothetical protein